MLRSDADAEANRAAVIQPLAADAANLEGCERAVDASVTKDADNVRIRMEPSSPEALIVDRTNGSPRHLDWRAVWQMVSMSLGVGVFAVPYTFKALGVLQGSLWVVVMGCFANFALQLLLDLAATHKIASYEGLAEHAFGVVGQAVMSVLTLITTFIACLSYLGAARELLVGVAAAFFVDVDVNSVPNGVEVLGQAKNVVVLIVLVAATMPLCLSPTMGDNAWISKAGVFSITTAAIFFVGSCAVLLASGCSGAHCGEQPHLITGSVADAFHYTATLAFSYSMVFAVFPVLGERVVEGDIAGAVVHMKPVATVSVAVCSACYVLVGTVGAFTFGSATRPVALGNLALSQGLTQVITLLVGASSTLLVAIISFPTVCSLELLGQLVRSARSPNLSEDGGQSGCRCFGGPARPWLVLLVGVLVVVVDSGLPTKIAFALCGSLGLATTAYVGPCVLYLKLDNSRRWQRMVAPVVLVFGLALLFGSTPVTVWKLIVGDSEAAPEKLSDVLADMLCHKQ